MTDNQSEESLGGLYPTRVMCPRAWQRSKSPWSLALTVTDNQSEGRRGGTFSDSLRPSWPQSLFSVEFLLNGKLIEQL